MLSGLTYRWWASSSPNAAHTSLQWSLSAGSISSSAATTSSASPTRSSSAPKRSTGSSSAMSGRSRLPARPAKAPVAAAISASSRCSTASSAAGAISTSSTSPSERWVKVENQRSDSISTSNMSTRTARSSVAGNTSSSPPRRANWPRSSTWSTRS